MVIKGDALMWGSWTTTLPWERPPTGERETLTAWMDKGAKKLFYIFNRGGSELTFVEHGDTSVDSCPTVWMGIVGGSLARIVQGATNEILRWRDIEVSPVSRDETILHESVKAVNGGIQFATRPVHGSASPVGRGYSVQGTNVASRPLPSGRIVVTDDKRILVLTYEYSTSQLYEFTEGAVRKIGEHSNDFLPPSTIPMRGWGFRKTIVLVSEDLAKTPDARPCFLTQGEGSRPDLWGNKLLGLERFHHGIGFHVMNYQNHPCLRWRIPTACDSKPLPLVFPTYGLGLEHFTPVTDSCGRAIMAARVEGTTIHVLRYPLPS